MYIKTEYIRFLFLIFEIKFGKLMIYFRKILI